MTVAGIQEQHGTLALNGSTTITNDDGSNYGLWVQNDAIVQGTGPLTLQSIHSPFNFASTSSTASVYTGPISGFGDLEIGTNLPSNTPVGTLVVGSAANSYSGGTIIAVGELKLERDPNLLSPATLGSGGADITPPGTLDLNGCSLTLSSLNGQADAASEGGTITDDSIWAGSPAPVTVLTLDNTTLCKFAGFIASGGSNPAIRFVKTGAGGLWCSQLDMGAAGGFEIDDGPVKEIAVTYLASAIIGLDMNGGSLDLNGTGGPFRQLDGTGGAIFDSTPQDGSSSMLLNLRNSGHPSVFGGDISLLGNQQNSGLDLDGFGSLTLTGTINCNVEVESAWLQIGDGRSGSTNGSLTGTVYVGTQDGLTFDVTEGTTAEYGGAISFFETQNFGSVLKIGGGNLILTGTNTYLGALRVDAGTLTLASAGALSAGTQLIVDNGAEVDLNGYSPASPLQSVTLNEGQIINTAFATVTATLAASESFNLADGTIGEGVNLAGDASLNKRTDGTVTIYYTDELPTLLNRGGGVYDDQGTLQYSTGAAVPLTSNSLTTLYWEPTSGDTWDTDNTTNWSTTPGGPTNSKWEAGDIAVFDTHYANGVTNVVISGSVSAAEIQINDGNFDIEDDGMTGSYISVPDSRSLEVYVDASVTAWLGCPVSADGTNQTGSFTKEGGGTLVFGTNSSGTVQTFEHVLRRHVHRRREDHAGERGRLGDR